ncbi:MAG: hypothetical protein WC700_07800 [Gemmatimonadaceae bacterium]|jgi:hypothetical protein
MSAAAPIEEKKQRCAYNACSAPDEEVRRVCRCDAGWHPKCQARVVERDGADARCRACGDSLVAIDRSRLCSDLLCGVNCCGVSLVFAASVFVIVGIDYAAAIPYEWAIACLLYVLVGPVVINAVNSFADNLSIRARAWITVGVWFAFIVMMQLVGVAIMYAIYSVPTWNAATAGLGVLAAAGFAIAICLIAVVTVAARRYVAGLYRAKPGPIATSV